MMRVIPTTLAALLLTAFGAAQQSQLVDLTLQNGIPTTQATQPNVLGSASGRAAACDDFNRANSTVMGPWVEQVGDLEVLNNMVHQAAGAGQRATMTHTSGSSPVAGCKVEFDLDGSKTSLVYAAAVIGFNPANGEDIYVKIQNQSGAPGYNTYGFYHGNGAGGYNGWGGFRSFPSQIPGGRVTVSVDASGDVVTLEIDTDFNGTVDFTDTAPGLIASGLAGLLGTENGYAGYGDEYSDNWELNDGCGGGSPSLSVSNLVAGAVANISVANCTPSGTVRHGYSLFGGGPTGTPYGNLLLTPPYKELPKITCDAAGAGSFSGPVPPGSTGITVWFHAFDLGSLTFTNGVSMAIG